MKISEFKTHLSLKNSWNYQGDNRWEWEAFIDDQGSGELSKVDHVEYVLHPTFPKPIRKVTNSKGGFVMKTGGWGTFPLKAFVYTKDGKKIKLEHRLTLKHDPPVGSSD